MKTATEQFKQEQGGWDKKSSPDILLMLSATLFAIIFIISTFLFFDNKILSSSIEANKTEIIQYTASIEKIKSDKKIIAAELVTNNKSDILGTIKVSEVQNYINELQNVSRKYKMIFSGFSYVNGKITTSAVSMAETVLSGDDGVRKISRLVKDYRTETGTGYLFQLSPILSVSGYEQKRSFSLEFNVGNTSQK